MSKDAILGVARHILTFAGGILVTEGVLDEPTMLDGVAAVITIAGIVWSIRQKKKLA